MYQVGAPVFAESKFLIEIEKTITCDKQHNYKTEILSRFLMFSQSIGILERLIYTLISLSLIQHETVGLKSSLGLWDENYVHV